jgi:HSP20 family molecular chaperone IbpA
MTDHDNDDRDTGSRDDWSNGAVGDIGGLLGRLQSLARTLAEIEELDDGVRRGSGHIDRGRGRIDYDYHVSTGLTPDGARSRGQSSVETRVIDGDDHLLVVADLSGVDSGECDARLDREAAAVDIHDQTETLERVALGERDTPVTDGERLADDATITDVTRNNDVLCVRLARTQHSEGGGES